MQEKLENNFTGQIFLSALFMVQNLPVVLIVKVFLNIHSIKKYCFIIKSDCKNER